VHHQFAHVLREAARERGRERAVLALLGERRRSSPVRSTAVNLKTLLPARKSKPIIEVLFKVNRFHGFGLPAVLRISGDKRMSRNT